MDAQGIRLPFPSDPCPCALGSTAAAAAAAAATVAATVAAAITATAWHGMISPCVGDQVRITINFIRCYSVQLRSVLVFISSIVSLTLTAGSKAMATVACKLFKEIK